MSRKLDVIRETDTEAIRLAKTLLRTARFGAIAVLEPDTGAPFASRVGVATDLDGTPLTLISGLAAHTGALVADPRCSLLVGEPGKGDALAHPRLSLTCRARQLERGTAAGEQAARRYLYRNPKAKLYAGLGDFAFFRLEIERASLNAGFGKAYLLERNDLIVDGAATDELAEAEQRAVDHMNADHRDAIDAYAAFYAKATGSGWTISGIDAEGLDLVNGDRARRIFFPAPLEAASGLRSVLVDMARQAREGEGSRSAGA